MPPRPATGPGRALRIGVRVLAFGYLALSLLEAALAFPAGREYAAAARAGVDTLEVFTAYDLVGVLWMPLHMALFVVGGLYLLRCRQLADLVAPRATHSRRAGWGLAGWIVPVVNLWFPYQYVRDVLRALTGQRSFGGLVGFWWAAWLVQQAIAETGARISLTSGDPETLERLGIVESVNAVATAVALTLWLGVLARLDQVTTTAGSPLVGPAAAAPVSGYGPAAGPGWAPPPAAYPAYPAAYPAYPAPPAAYPAPPAGYPPPSAAPPQPPARW